MSKTKEFYHDEIIKNMNFNGQFQIPCRTIKIIAMSSLTEDDKHILIWDFDSIKEHDMLKALSKIQKIHGLGTIYVFKSNHGYNAVCLDKIHIKEAHNIKMYTRFSDYTHTRIGYQIGSWCMRLGKDKEYLYCLHTTDTYKGRIQSNAHKEFLKKEFRLKDCFFGEFDKFNKVFFESYKQDLIP